jgi:hypothetical protein
MSDKARYLQEFLEKIGSAGYGGIVEYETALQFAREIAVGDYGSPDAWCTDEFSADHLDDLLDNPSFGTDSGAIHEVNGIHYGPRQFVVTNWDEDGFTDHRIFDSEEEAKAFAATLVSAA